MPMMKAVQVGAPGAAFELVERPMPSPGAGEVLIKVEACGICRGDVATKEARHAAITLPRVPGHEVVGTVVETGSPGAAFAVGQRVGVGWRGGYCRRCDACRRGDFHACRNPLTTGQSMDGGYAEYMIAQEEAVVTIPDGITAAEAAPLLCAGRTTFSALKAGGAKRGDLVAIHGIGGLGHLAIQYAARLGCRTAALSRGTAKEALARQLGAEFYIDTSTGDAAAQLQAIGGARVLFCTAPNAKEASRLIDGLGRNGRMVVVGSTNDPLEIPTRALIGQGIVISGAGYATIDDALRFSMEVGVRPMIETFPLADAAIGFDKMMNATVNFRAVLTMNG
jgi:D-arabinose 1-dehydrogenase-like Zn-dependent alcohol dehydrogenase